jgi:aminopeptidase N/ABC-type transport system involved in multi-copper enzyme maturation permease subunit
LQPPLLRSPLRPEHDSPRTAMLAKIAAFELRYQLRSPLFFVACAIFFLLSFGSVTIDQIQLGGRGNVNLNSPHAIMVTVGTFGVFALFVVVAFVANVVVRDEETGFAPILRATPMGKRDFLVGRFVGATTVAFLVIVSVALGVLLGSFMPWLDPERVGPLHLSHYAYALFFYALPTLLVMAAGFFAVATITRSMMSSYVAAVVFLVGFFLARGALRDPQWDNIVALVDPFGLAAYGLVTKYWTATERNTQLPPMAGPLLANRALWFAIAFALFALAYRLFHFETRGSRIDKKKAKQKAVPAAAAARPEPVAVAARFGAGTGWRQLLALARFDMAFVFRSPAFFVLLGIGILNSLGALWFATSILGTEVFPVTRIMVERLQGAFSIIPVLIAVYYAGELVWRDRQQRIHEIVDAAPAPDWAHVAPKIVAIILVLAATMVVSIVTAIVVQAFKGYFNFELGRYVEWQLLPGLIGFAQFAILAVFVQAIVPHKFIGWAVMLIYIIASVTLENLGFGHRLYNFGSTPPVPLSDMNGSGRFWIGQTWLQIYWTAFSILLALLAYGLWRRGTELRLRPRLQRLPYRFAGAAGVTALVATAVLVGSGTWTYYNTNILNDYLSDVDFEHQQAEYEKALLGFEKIEPPRITDVKLQVELYPRAVRAVTQGSYKIENRSNAPINEVHVRWDPRLRMDALAIDGGSLQKEYKHYNYRIYKLEPALAPNEKRSLTFASTLEERGFPSSRPLTRIVENGTFIDNTEITPMLGMGRDKLLRDRSKRRKYGLDPNLRMAKLEDEAASAHHYLRHDSDFVNAEITFSTDADQVLVAPGRKVEETEKDGRRTARFVTDAPIHHFFSLQSAHYAVKTDRVQLPAGPVDLAVYYHPAHAYNVDRMLTAMKTSLELYSEAFSPYQFNQARVLEFPAYATFAQAFSNTMPYSEAIGFIVNARDPEKIDLVTYVTAHEVAHQWWAHQVIGADKQGSTMLSESFAQYSALLVMEKLYGREQVRKFLKFELDRYLRSRGSEVIEELPLARVENQPYIHYQKGTLVMYWLREVVGVDKVNRAMARFLNEHAFKPAPYPSSADFLRILREEAGPQHDALITDLFERITLVDVKTTAARTTKRPDGRYDVTLDIEARKLYADGKGKETEAPLDEPFDVGVFSAEPGKKDFKAESVLLFERRPIHTGKQTLTLTVDKLPKYAGVDPYNKRIDRNSDDNVKPVE